MSDHPGVPYYAPYPSPAPPPRRRPSWGWYLVGAGLLVAAVAAGIVLFALTLRGALATDAEVRADGVSHEVTVPTDGERFLWLRQGSDQSCTVTDGGTPVDLPRPGARYTRSSGDGQYVAAARFDPGSGRLTVTCQGGGIAEIGPAWHVGGFVGSLLLTIVVPLLLGIAGIAVLVVTGVLRASRRPRTGNVPGV